MKTNSQSLYAHLRTNNNTVDPPINFFRQDSGQILSHRRRKAVPVEKYGETQEVTHRFGGDFGTKSAAK